MYVNNNVFVHNNIYHNTNVYKNTNINRNTNINNRQNWNHDVSHRGNVNYNNKQLNQKYNKSTQGGLTKDAARGTTGPDRAEPERVM